MKNFLLIALMFVGLAVAQPAMAMDLHEARDAGLVGEQLDGYVAAVKPSAAIDALVADVNAGRKAEYARISKENGQPVSVVAKLAAEQIIKGLKKGSQYQNAKGEWMTR